MSYGNEVLKVCRLENGLEVEVYEPAPPKKGEAGDSKKDSCCGPMLYEEPWKAYAFESDEAALAFIAEKLPALRRKSADDEMADAFNEAVEAK